MTYLKITMDVVYVNGNPVAQFLHQTELEPEEITSEYLVKLGRWVNLLRIDS